MLVSIVILRLNKPDESKWVTSKNSKNLKLSSNIPWNKLLNKQRKPFMKLTSGEEWEQAHFVTCPLTPLQVTTICGINFREICSFNT